MPGVCIRPFNRRRDDSEWHNSCKKRPENFQLKGLNGEDDTRDALGSRPRIGGGLSGDLGAEASWIVTRRPALSLVSAI